MEDDKPVFARNEMLINIQLLSNDLHIFELMT